MDIRNFRNGDIIYVEECYGWIMQFDCVKNNSLYNYNPYVLTGSKEIYSDGLWGDIDTIKESRYATDEEIDLYKKALESKKGIKFNFSNSSIINNYQIY